MSDNASDSLWEQQEKIQARWYLNSLIWSGEYATNGSIISFNGESIQAIVSNVTPPSPINANVVITVQKTSLASPPSVDSTVVFNDNTYIVNSVFDKNDLYTIWLQ